MLRNEREWYGRTIKEVAEENFLDVKKDIALKHGSGALTDKDQGNFRAISQIAECFQREKGCLPQGNS